MPVTLVTSGLCGLVFLWLSLRVVSVRRSAGVAIGDGGDARLLERIRAHANFAEYVPLCLVLIGAVEFAYEETPPGLWIPGLALVVARILHPLGMSRPAPNGFRVLGVLGTWLVLLGLSVWAIYLGLVPPPVSDDYV